MLGAIFCSISENYDVPSNLHQKHLRVFIKDDSEDTSGKSREQVVLRLPKLRYSELVMFDLKDQDKDSAKLMKT